LPVAVETISPVLGSTRTSVSSPPVGSGVLRLYTGPRLRFQNSFCQRPSVSGHVSRVVPSRKAASLPDPIRLSIQLALPPLPPESLRARE